MTERRATVELAIPFHDLDPMEVVWHGNYARYFEHARSALLQTFDYDYPQMRESGFAWPIVEINIRYAQPLTYQQRIRITATLVEWEQRLRMRYEIHDVLSGKRLTRGHTVQVAVDMRSREMRYVSPAILFEKLGLPAPCDNI